MSLDSVYDDPQSDRTLYCDQNSKTTTNCVRSQSERPKARRAKGGVIVMAKR